MGFATIIPTGVQHAYFQAAFPETDAFHPRRTFCYGEKGFKLLVAKDFCYTATIRFRVSSWESLIASNNNSDASSGLTDYAFENMTSIEPELSTECQAYRVLS